MELTSNSGNQYGSGLFPRPFFCILYCEASENLKRDTGRDPDFASCASTDGRRLSGTAACGAEACDWKILHGCFRVYDPDDLVVSDYSYPDRHISIDVPNYKRCV